MSGEVIIQPTTFSRSLLSNGRIYSLITHVQYKLDAIAITAAVLLGQHRSKPKTSLLSKTSPALQAPTSRDVVLTSDLLVCSFLTGGGPSSPSLIVTT